MIENSLRPQVAMWENEKEDVYKWSIHYNLDVSVLRNGTRLS